MYKVLKDKGHNSNITVMNIDTGASVIIGRLTIDILKILELEGYTFGDDKPMKLKDAWDLGVSDTAGTLLAERAFKIAKPDRDQSKKSEQILNNKKIDAMDVLLGLASYK